MRTIFWENNELKMIDQRRLPAALEIVAFRGHKEVAQAIKDMVVRGAPAIGAAGAFGLALAARGIRCGLDRRIDRRSTYCCRCSKICAADGSQPGLGGQ